MPQRNILIVGPLACFIFGAPAAAQPSLQWVEQFGTNKTDSANALSPDGSGGVFLAGYTSGNLGGPNAGGYDVIIARRDADGAPLWLRQFGTDKNDIAYALAPDGAGGFFVAGITEGSLKGQNIGLFDTFLARCDAHGNQVWIVQYGSEAYDWALALATDGAGGVYLAGLTKGGLAGPHLGEDDAFLVRFDSKGNRVWTRQFGTEAPDQARALTPDGVGGVFIAGQTRGDLDGPNAGADDAFIAHYDSGGTQDWLHRLGTSGTDQIQTLAPDGSGGVFMAGTSNGDLGGPIVGGYDAILARYTALGAQDWLVQFGTIEDEFAFALVADPMGGVSVAGFTEGDLGGPNAGIDDAFISHFTGAGIRTSDTKVGTDASDEAVAAAPDGLGGAFVAGYTDGDLDGPNAGGSDVFLARFSSPCYADINLDGVLDLFDFLAYVNLFNKADPRADCSQDLDLNLFDFLCFVNAFNAGCP